MRSLVLIAHNLRSAHNVGSLLRTAEGLGLKTVYLTGYTPYPRLAEDKRLPHVSNKLTRQIHKTALGAEQSLPIIHEAKVELVMAKLKAAGYQLVALEQTAAARRLDQFKPPGKLALIVGREVEGLESNVIKLCDQVLEIPMLGQKESFNVSAAAAMALYYLRFMV